ncbi:hypothetical protein FHX75_111715 [Micromonospora palomenae]|uniref:Uncharacterized protein n=1 Tax=Micromonospora palomenae TaxID=1461247 RepID=A0A561WXH6_9ACTN|nr:hypothetical protein [Micromonospora palomenae]TWG28563.1 hypothetical protein FHX75_111715 [Micromonospora palomenae]
MTAPRTLIGSYLAMLALRKVEERERCRAELSRTRWVDADEVTNAALLLTIRRYLGPKPNFIAVGKTAVRTSRIFPKGDIAPRDVERIIRNCLGEDDAIEKLKLKNPELLRMLTFASLLWIHKVPEAEVLEIIAQAEEEAFDTGFSPTLLTG